MRLPAALVHSQAPGYTTSCQWVTPAQTFDLSTMTLPAGSTYASTDVRDKTKTYYYNFCGAMGVTRDVAGTP